MRFEVLFDDKRNVSVGIDIADLSDLEEYKPETRDAQLPWLSEIPYGLYIDAVARLEEGELVLYPLSGYRPVLDQRSRLRTEADRRRLEIKTRRWGDHLLIWRADHKVEVEIPKPIQDYDQRRRRRRNAELTQLEVAKRVGISQAALSGFERGYLVLPDHKLSSLDQVLAEAEAITK